MNRNLILVDGTSPSQNSRFTRQANKLLTSSLSRTFLEADIVVFHNDNIPLFLSPRSAVREILLPDDITFLSAAQQIPENYYEKIIYLKSGTLALRNLDHLFDPLRENWDMILYERHDKNFATELWMIKGHLWTSFLNKLAISFKSTSSNVWQKQFCMTLHKVRDTDGYILGKFELNEVCFPLDPKKTWSHLESASLIHAGEIDTSAKLKFLYAAYMQQFFFDDSLTLFNFLES